MIGYSQGGLLSRVALQYYPDHCVKTFISLSSPQAGQYGGINNIFTFVILNFVKKLFFRCLSASDFSISVRQRSL
jgi:palmitoyl-protein thioesterase